MTAVVAKGLLEVLADYSAQHGDPEDFTNARAAVAELIEVLDVVETWMDAHALPALGDDTDGGHALLASVREALVRAQGGAK